MARLLLYVIFVVILYSAIRFLLKALWPLSQKGSKEPEPEELVLDPYCQTYIPKKSAVKKRIAGKDHYFCNLECLRKFFEEEPRFSSRESPSNPRSD